jgi:predicted aconitase with swiveling domain
MLEGTQGRGARKGLRSSLHMGKAPKGIMNVKPEGVVAMRAITTDTPMVHELEEDPCGCIEKRDFVRMNAAEGSVEIEKHQTR